MPNALTILFAVMQISTRSWVITKIRPDAEVGPTIEPMNDWGTWQSRDAIYLFVQTLNDLRGFSSFIIEPAVERVLPEKRTRLDLESFSGDLRKTLGLAPTREYALTNLVMSLCGSWRNPSQAVIDAAMGL